MSPIRILLSNLLPFRFGNLAYCSEEIRRKIRIVNDSCIPLKVMWHNFLRISTISNSDTKFNMVFDIMSKGYNKNDAELIITDKYYGAESNNLFTVNLYIWFFTLFVSLLLNITIEYNKKEIETLK